MHHHESIKLLYLPEELGGSGMKSVEDTYKLTTIKMANYLNNSDGKRIKCARTLEMNRITQGRRSIFKQATKYAAEYDIICTFDDTGTTISASKDSTAATETKTITTPSSTALKELLRSKIAEKYTKEAEEQNWLGDYTNKQRQGKQLPLTANQILKKRKNIPDIVYSVNKTIRQQLLPTKTYQQSKAQMTITDTNCRMCHTATESTTHVLSACSKIAQTLYTARHDRMLRPIYHCLLDKYNFQESDHGKPWYQQSAVRMSFAERTSFPSQQYRRIADFIGQRILSHTSFPYCGSEKSYCVTVRPNRFPASVTTAKRKLVW